MGGNKMFGAVQIAFRTEESMDAKSLLNDRERGIQYSIRKWECKGSICGEMGAKSSLSLSAFFLWFCSFLLWFNNERLLIVDIDKTFCRAMHIRLIAGSVAVRTASALCSCSLLCNLFFETFVTFVPSLLAIIPIQSVKTTWSIWFQFKLMTYTVCILHTSPVGMCLHAQKVSATQMPIFHSWKELFDIQ